MALWGGIEAGGTKVICALGRGPDAIAHQIRIPTTHPTQTLADIVDFFHSHPRPLAIGVGSFGPVDLNPSSGTYGYLLNTPKPGWQRVDLLGALGRSLDLPLAIETDVNVAALGEHRWGAAQEIENFVYLTVGTGIGGGAMVHGRLLHGLLHPEMGHMALPRDPRRDPFGGVCPVHGDCLEGLASGTAIAQRWGQPAETLPPEHPAWDLEVDYLTQGLVNLIYSLSPQRIILGGGIMAQGHLLPRLRQGVGEAVGRYLQIPGLLGDLETYLVTPQLGERAGILGAIALAQNVVS